MVDLDTLIPGDGAEVERHEPLTQGQQIRATVVLLSVGQSSPSRQEREGECPQRSPT